MSRCWVCDSGSLALVRKSAWNGEVRADSFAITNSDYGVTGDVERCGECGFMQCSSMRDVLKNYEDLVDPEFEATRSARSIQERKLVGYIKKIRAGGRFLDIGAGSGAMVEEALKAGFGAEGVEPSRWLSERAKERGLPVHTGTIPHPSVRGPYDVISMVDVIEHVLDPFELVCGSARLLSDNGVIAVVTPDAASFAARCLGWKWWHYRLAHVGYFTGRSLDLLFKRAGLERVSSTHPSWFFGLDYLITRVQRYLPRLLRFKVPRSLSGIVVPVNLRDSILHVYAKRAAS